MEQRDAGLGRSERRLGHRVLFAVRARVPAAEIQLQIRTSTPLLAVKPWLSVPPTWRNTETPLRDALIHLELEGFVTILPRRGVCVNELQLQDVKNAYDSIGLVEAYIVTDCIDKIKSSHIQKLEDLNEKMISDLEKNDFSRFFKTNLKFHNVYLDISDNEPLKKFIIPLKHRLYDFPRQNYIKEWELQNCEEHGQFLDHLKQGNAEEAAKILKDIHWSFEYQKDFIYAFYDAQLL